MRVLLCGNYGLGNRTYLRSLLLNSPPEVVYTISRELAALDTGIPVGQARLYSAALGRPYRLFNLSIYLRYLRRFTEHVRVLRNDDQEELIHCHCNFLLNDHAYVASFDIDPVSLMRHYHGMNPHEHPPPKALTGIMRKVYSLLGQRDYCRRIISFSDATRASLISYGIPDSKIVVIPPQIRVMPPPKKTQASSGPVKVLFIGRDFWRKGGDILLSAFESIKRDFPDIDWELILVSNVPSRFRHTFRNESRITFLSKIPREELQNLYDGAHIFCMPSRFEALGLVFLEAMERKLPLIGTRVWGVPDMISDGFNGFLVPPGGPEELASKLVLLLGDPMLRSKMGIRGRELIKAKFSTYVVGHQMREVYEEALKK